MNPNETQVPDQNRELPLESPRRAPKGVIFVGLAMLAIFILGIAPRLAVGRKLDEKRERDANHTSTVHTIKLKSTPGEIEVTLPSNIQAIEETSINAHTGGYVRARYVDIGSRVTAGQILADIDSPELDQQLVQSEAEVSNAKASVGQARANVTKAQASITGVRSDYVRYQANLGEARAKLVHLQARYAQAQAATDVAKSRVRQAAQRLEGSKAELARANVEKDIAQKTLHRWKELEKADAVSGQEVDEKQSNFDSNQAKVNAAEANVNSAEADVEAAKQTVKAEESDELAAKADIQSGIQGIEAAKAAIEMSRANIEAAIASHHASQSIVSGAQASVASNQAIVRRFASIQAYEHIVAPFAGVITARNIDAGDLVNASVSGTGASDQATTVTHTGLFGLARTDVMRAQVNVPEDMISSIRQGQEAEVMTQEFPGQPMKGHVFHVSGALDSLSRTLLVEVTVPNPKGTLKPGMYAQVRFLASKAKSALRIPANTFLFDSKGTRVATLTSQNTVHFQAIRVGRDFGDEIEVVKGLSGNETLIANPDETLQEGQKVSPVEKSL